MTKRHQLVGKKVRLGDICEICSGGTPKRTIKEYWNNGDIPWVKISDISEKYVASTEESITETGLKNSSAKLLDPGTLLFSIFASIGAVGILSIPATTNQAIAGLKIFCEEVDRDYLFHYLKSQESIAKSSGRGAAQNNINLTILRNMEVPVPELNTQREIALAFELIDREIKNNERQISQLDSLVKSRFVEMFGDIDNTQYEVVTIQDLCEPIKDGTHKTPTYAHGPEDGVMFLSSKDVTTGKIDWNNTKYITPTLHEELKKRVSPRKGDVLLAKNGTTGICAVVDRDEVFDLYVTLALLRPLAGVDSYYLWAAVNADRTKMQFDSRLKGIGVPNLHLKEIKETLLVKPPLSLQREFATFVHQVDKLKFDLGVCLFILREETFRLSG